MDFADSPEELDVPPAAARLADARTTRASRPSSTADEYWAGQAAWHQTLYDAGFFGLSWPTEVGGHGLPSVYEVILDEELITAGTPPRPSVGYLVQGILRHGSEDDPAPLPARAGERPRTVVPGLQRARRRLRPGVAAHAGRARRRPSTSSPATRCGRATRTPPTGAWSWPGPIPTCPQHKGISAFVVPMGQPAIEQRPLQMINGVTREFGEVLFDGARVDAANMVGEPGEGWRLAMTVVSHEREPGELGYVARYGKLVNELAHVVAEDPARFGPEAAARPGLGPGGDRDAALPREPPALGPPRRPLPRARGLRRQAAR